jgi:Na+-transporting methylmalonyl-CoA/oxaloacetate decarboxylase gamma subunit
MSDETGSVVVGVAVVAVLIVLAGVIGAVGAVAATYARAATAADAAALASAPVTFRPFGAVSTARVEAQRLATANGANLVRCVCVEDRSWAPRTVSVTVARSLRLPVVGEVTITASSRATFDPGALLGSSNRGAVARR